MKKFDANRYIRQIAENKANGREVMVRAYALVIQNHWSTVDWTRANAAIMKRWSKSSLGWIKREAWELVEKWKKDYAK